MTTRPMHRLFALLLTGLIAGPTAATGIELTSYSSGIPLNFPGTSRTLLTLVCASSVGFNGDFNPCEGIGDPIPIPLDLIPTARELIQIAPSIVEQLVIPCRPTLSSLNCPSPPDALRDDLAIRSWNLLVSLVASGIGPEENPGAFVLSDPYRLTGCSYANPAACLTVQQALLVPEPGTALGLGLGLALLGLRARRA